MKKILAIAALGEAGTGLVLLGLPSLVVQLLFASGITDIGVVISRITGISLISLGVACWPGRAGNAGLCGMLTYSLLVALYFIYLGVAGEWNGKLLWPAVAIHAVLSVLLALAWFNERKAREWDA